MADENPNSFIHEHLERGDATGWFEEVYARAQGNGDGVPWAVLRPRPAFVEWAQRTSLKGKGKRALVVGCGLGDDAEELARRGFAVTSFDIAPSAVAWCQQRFPNSTVDYRVADLFAPPAEWQGRFDFVLEIFTIQALPIAMREQTIAAIARFVDRGGEIFVLTRVVADPTAGRFGPPWPLTRAEVDHFRRCGLAEVMMEELPDGGGGLGLSLRALYRRET
jgi:2-polyprenyl-3-methyl-5-hydroxy-6-metoxy-1,4-benzoquinol methylase